jgi:hypothetical protein
VQGAAVDALLPDDRPDARAGAVVVRVHEARGRAGALVVPGRRGTVIDLTGAERATFDGEMALRPHQIVTLRLEPPEG